MIIGFDAKRIVRNGTGLGNYGRTLVNDLSGIVPEDTALRLYAPDAGKERFRSQLRESSRMSMVYPRGHVFKSWWRSQGIVSDLQRDGVDLYHGLSGELPIGIRKSGVRSVVTIHDLIFLRHPEYYHWLDTKIYAWKFRQTVREADRIIAISECTKRDIIHYGGVNPDKIDVIYQSCGTHFRVRESEDRLQEIHARYSLPARYIINVGTIEKRKNILLAVQSLAYLPEELALVIVGRPTPYMDKVLRHIERHHLSHRVHLLHNIPNADLPGIYQMAEACVYPSRYEGFGIPIIEAVQSGLPVVACTGSCLEEAGGPDCLYVHPDDVRGMAEAVKQVIKGADGRDNRIIRSMEYIRRFEGNNVARQVWEVYDKIRKM